MVSTALSRKARRTKYVRGKSEFHFLLTNEKLIKKKTVFIFSLLTSHTLICIFVRIHLDIFSLFLVTFLV